MLASSAKAPPTHQVRARHTDRTITVYQAYPAIIAEPSVAAGRLVPPFKPDRMTWIKPSFLWMMYRSGWATKPGQERVLAIEITRDGFEWALEHSCASSFDRERHPDRDTWAELVRTRPVRVQWDPERSLRLGPLQHRCVQVGLGGQAVERYVDEWTISITDVTALAKRVHEAIMLGQLADAAELLPVERPYPLPAHIAETVGADG